MDSYVYVTVENGENLTKKFRLETLQKSDAGRELQKCFQLEYEPTHLFDKGKKKLFHKVFDCNS